MPACLVGQEMGSVTASTTMPNVDLMVVTVMACRRGTAIPTLIVLVRLNLITAC